MKLSELISEPLDDEDDVEVVTDPCRMLAPGKRQMAEEVIHFHGGTVRVILVEDEETGLITRQYLGVDGHLGGVED